MPGTAINRTGELLAVYGTKSASTPQDKDNALYKLPDGRKTPPGWDCDGVFIPSDRVGDQLIGSDVPGPAAIKYVGALNFEITKSGNKYKLPANQGAFGPNEVCCPSNYPRCVCWNIPALTQSQISNLPEVPGHIPA